MKGTSKPIWNFYEFILAKLMMGNKICNAPNSHLFITKKL